MNDELKKIAYEILRSKGYSARESKMALGQIRFGLSATNKQIIKDVVVACSDTIEHLRDRGRVATKAYQGRAYFWSHRYKHYLRDATPAQRRRVHDKFLSQGMPLDGETSQHDKIISRVFKCAI